MNISNIDKDSVSVNGNIFKRVDSEDEPLICTLDGYEYYLGPECPDELSWQEAVDWCKNLGHDYELPSRVVMLMVCMNPTVFNLINKSYYWTSTEVGASSAWAQYWRSSGPGAQGYFRKSFAYKLRAVRKVKVRSKSDA